MKATYLQAISFRRLIILMAVASRFNTESTSAMVEEDGQRASDLAMTEVDLALGLRKVLRETWQPCQA